MLMGTFENYLVKYREAEHFLATAQGVLAKAHTPPPAPATALSAADELAKLADLHRQGILNAEGFRRLRRNYSAKREHFSHVSTQGSIQVAVAGLLGATLWCTRHRRVVARAHHSRLNGSPILSF
jgi:hypothetical protein